MSVLVFQHMEFTPLITLNNWKRCHHHNWCILSVVHMTIIVSSYPSVGFREAHGGNLTYLGEAMTRWPAMAAFQTFTYPWILFSVCVKLLRIIRCYNPWVIFKWGISIREVELLVPYQRRKSFCRLKDDLICLHQCGLTPLDVARETLGFSFLSLCISFMLTPSAFLILFIQHKKINHRKIK